MAANSALYDLGGADVETGLLLLGLDAVALHYARLGLQFDIPPRVQHVARESWAWWTRDPDRHRGEGDTPTAIAGFVVAAADRAGGTPDGPRVVTWLRRFAARRAVEPVVDGWTATLLRLDASDTALLARFGMVAPSIDKTRHALEALADRWDQVELIGAGVESAVSAWDRRQVQMYHPDYDVVTPLSALSGWLYVEAFVSTVQPLFASLSPTESRLLELWVTSLAEVRGRLPRAGLSIAAARSAMAQYTGS